MEPLVDLYISLVLLAIGRYVGTVRKWLSGKFIVPLLLLLGIIDDTTGTGGQGRGADVIV